jgi:hypothetical protein
MDILPNYVCAAVNLWSGERNGKRIGKILNIAANDVQINGDDFSVPVDFK